MHLSNVVVQVARPEERGAAEVAAWPILAVSQDQVGLSGDVRGEEKAAVLANQKLSFAGMKFLLVPLQLVPVKEDLAALDTLQVFEPLPLMGILQVLLDAAEPRDVGVAQLTREEFLVRVAVHLPRVDFQLPTRTKKFLASPTFHIIVRFVEMILQSLGVIAGRLANLTFVGRTFDSLLYLT